MAGEDLPPGLLGVLPRMGEPGWYPGIEDDARASTLSTLAPPPQDPRAQGVAPFSGLPPTPGYTEARTADPEFRDADPRQRFIDEGHRDIERMTGDRPGTFASNTVAGLAGPAIVDTATARALRMATRLPNDPHFLRAVENTPGARIVDDGLEMRVMRSQKPEQSGAQAVRSGVFYLPEAERRTARANPYNFPTNTQRTGGQGPSWYGGSEYVAGDTLLRAPLAVRGSTGGGVPERAMRELTSADRAAMLERDIQRLHGPATLPASLRDAGVMRQWEEDIADFLNYWGGDPGVAAELLRNSREGNRLRYALREHAVAATARNAGYDSVIGTGARSPRITEVFDVRESAYPVPGSPEHIQLHPRFEGLLGSSSQ